MFYVRDDIEAVSQLESALRQHGVNVWLDRRNIKHGQRWKTAICAAIKEGAFFIACFSIASIGRERTYMNEEITLAISELRQRPTDRNWFIFRGR